MSVIRRRVQEKRDPGAWVLDKGRRRLRWIDAFGVESSMIGGVGIVIEPVT
jgi:hypothetical protein